MKTAADEISMEAYEAILKSMRFEQAANSVWTLSLDPSKYDFPQLTVEFGADKIYLSAGEESKTVRMQGMYPQKLRREVDGFLFNVRSQKIANRVAHAVLAIRLSQFGRDFYIPHDVEAEKITPEGTDIEAFFYEQNGKFYGIAFAGKATKPVWHYRFSDRARFNAKLQELVKSRQERMETMNNRRQERMNYKHGLKEGDILYSSWGYDQTNIDFYQVIGVGERSVKIREVSGKVVREERGADYVVAVPNSFTGPAMTKIVGIGDRIRLTSYSSAGKWDGKPLYQTAAGYGH